VAYSPIAPAVCSTSLDLRSCDSAIVASLEPAIDRFKINAAARSEIAKRDDNRVKAQCLMTSARNDREGFLSRARDRFTVTSYVSALHIPGPCPETIWIPSTSYHNRRFSARAAVGLEFRVASYNRGSLATERSKEESDPPFIKSRSSYRPMAGRILTLKSGPTLFSTETTTPLPRREHRYRLLTYVLYQARRENVGRTWKMSAGDRDSFTNGSFISDTIDMHKMIKNRCNIIHLLW